MTKVSNFPCHFLKQNMDKERAKDSPSTTNRLKPQRDLRENYTAAALWVIFCSRSKQSSQRSEVGRFVRLRITTGGYCLQFLIQCHRSGSGPLTYSSMLSSKTAMKYEIFQIFATTAQRLTPESRGNITVTIVPFVTSL